MAAAATAGVPDWYFNPEDDSCKKEIQRGLNTLILPPDVLTSIALIIHKIEYKKVSGDHLKQPLSLRVVYGNHGCTVTPSTVVKSNSCSTHINAWLNCEKQVQLPANPAWSKIDLLSNCEIVSHLAHRHLIEKIKDLFVTGDLDVNTAQELLKALNESINAGQNAFIQKLKTALIKARLIKDQNPQNLAAYVRLTNILIDALLDAPLVSVGSFFPVGNLASINRQDIYDVPDSTPDLARSVYNMNAVLKIRGKGWKLILYMDIDRERLYRLGPQDHSTVNYSYAYWIGKFIEYTTTYPFLKAIVHMLESKLEELEHSDPTLYQHVVIALARLRELIDEGLKNPALILGNNIAATISCKIPKFVVREESDFVVMSPLLVRPSDIIVGYVQPQEKDLRKGFTGYFQLVPRMSNQQESSSRSYFINRVDFYTLKPQADCFLHFPNYHLEITDPVIDAHGGEVLDSVGRVQDDDSPQQFIDDDDEGLLPDIEQLESEILRAVEAKAAAAPAATAAATAAAASLDIIKKPPQQSIFKTILYKLSSIFGTARIGDINQPSTYFIDNDLNIDEILIKLCIIAADEADEADEAADASEHAFHAADDLIKLLSPVPSQLSDLVSRALYLAHAAATDAAAADLSSAAPAQSAAASHINKYVSIASFCARVVAYVYACNIAEKLPVVEFIDLPRVYNLDDVFSFAKENKPLVIQATLNVLPDHDNPNHIGTILDELSYLEQMGQSVSSTSLHLSDPHLYQPWSQKRAAYEKDTQPNKRSANPVGAHGGFREKHSNNSTSASSRGRRLRRSKRTLKKKNMSRKYCRRPRSRRPRGSYYSRKITKK